MEQNVEKKKKDYKKGYILPCMHFHFDDGNVILWK